VKPIDGEARAELLCFLVIGQLVRFAQAGVWLSTDHLIESAQIWLNSNGAECDWLERARLLEMSCAIASQQCKHPFLEEDFAILQLFSLQSGWYLDYRAPAVQRIYAICLSAIDQ
jgi:hypothetical protein